MKLKGVKTAKPAVLKRCGKMRWFINYKNGDSIDKYNGDGTKNVYCQKEQGNPKVYVNLNEASSIGLTDNNGNLITTLDVPDGAVVFQRRRVRDINYDNKFHSFTTTVPAGVYGGKYYKEKQVTKMYPERTYGECWLVGWRTSDALCYQVVYPDGKVDEFTEWDTKPWTYEPEWFADEQV